MNPTKLACALASATLVCAVSARAEPPAVVLANGGIQFPDGTVQETSAVVADGPATLTVVVDCDSGDSINAALQQPADQLTVEISGFCDEIVDLTRANVTLRGSSPLSDGIHASASLPFNTALLVRGVAGNVTIENLSFSGSVAAISVNYSFGVTFNNCRFESSSYAGGFVASAWANLNNTVITGNGSVGLNIRGGAYLSCSGVTVEANGTAGLGTGIILSQGSEARLENSSIEGKKALDLRGGSRAVVLGASSVLTGLPDGSGFGLAMAVDSTSSLDLSGGSIQGPFSARWKSLLRLSSTSQTIESGFTFANSISGDSTLLTSGTTSLAGNLDVSDFSNGVFPSGTTISGNLSCSRGADAYCEDPSGVTGTSSCSQCPTAP